MGRHARSSRSPSGPLAADDVAALLATTQAYLPRRFLTNDAITRGTTMAAKIAVSRHQKDTELSAEETPAIDAKSTAKTKILGQRGEPRSISQEARSGFGRASIHPDRAEATAAGTSQSIQSTATPSRIRSAPVPHRDEGGPFAVTTYRSSRRPGGSRVVPNALTCLRRRSSTLRSRCCGLSGTPTRSGHLAWSRRHRAG